MSQSFGAAFGLLVKRKRGERGWKQGALGALVFADRANNSPEQTKQDVSKLERGLIANPHERVVQAYCGVLDITPTELEDIRQSTAEPNPEIVQALIQRNATLSQQLHLSEKLVVELARRYATGPVETFDMALASFEAALRTAADLRARAALPSNTGDAVQAVLAEVARLNDLGKLEAADQAIDEAIAAQNAGLAALRDQGAAQARLRNRPDRAAGHLIERLRIGAPQDFVKSLQDAQFEYYKRGRSQGVSFDLHVSIHLAQAKFQAASNAESRGDALNDRALALQCLADRTGQAAPLFEAIEYFKTAASEWKEDQYAEKRAISLTNLGTSLASLGKQLGLKEKLYEAVEAHESALASITLAQAPATWAGIQNNLGSVLQEIGELSASPWAVDCATRAYHEAEKVWTRSAFPSEWAMVQHNLGNALVTFARLTRDAQHLPNALSRFEAALMIRTKDAEPMNWAESRNALANVLQQLGVATNTKPWISQAVQAHSEVLDVWNLEHAPINWAMTQVNLANDQLALFGVSQEKASLSDARSHVLAARDVFQQAKADIYLQQTNSLLTAIDRLSSGRS
ncbi:hypothetical protein ACSBLW_17370 [Thioclava sp. FR2]|uniref:hypothetical protein n=1 Tax=Thioclava sp. FR2 TaxID=3445780 RepID=UPI003EBA5645